MKASELRIGNIVYNPTLKQIRTIDCLDIRDLFEGRLWNPFEPIPITPEWLEKFGFTELSDDYIIGRFGNAFETHRIFSETGKGYEGFNVHFVESTYGGEQESNISARNDGDLLRSIKYVHQLQNLYFALTDEELTIVNQEQTPQPRLQE